MTRGKVKLEFITNDSKRKETFKKRKKGLLKKANELTTLCGVEACVIIDSPYDAQPEMWPNPNGVHRVVERFMGLSKDDQGKKMLDQEAYLEQRIFKVKQQLEKLKEDDKEKKATKLMYDYINGNMNNFEGLSLKDTNDLRLAIDKNLQLAAKRIEFLTKKD